MELSGSSLHRMFAALAPLRRGFFCGRAVQRCSGLVGPSQSGWSAPLLWGLLTGKPITMDRPN